MSKVGKQSVAESTGGGKGFLLGRYDHALDPKKRFTIPAGWRQILGDPQYVFVMPDNEKKCLNIIPQEEMEARLEKLREKAQDQRTISREASPTLPPSLPAE